MLDLGRRAAAEAFGTCVLVVAVIGSGIMAQRLSDDIGVVLLANTMATAAALVVLVTVLGPLSGAHLNPVVSLVFALSGDLSARESMVYSAAQIAGGLVGALTAHAMFELPLATASVAVRSGFGQWLGEGVATFGLVATILLGLRTKPTAVPMLVGLYIASAYWFTSSTSFANPAVTIARTLTSTFAGIRPTDAVLFIAAQLFGAAAGLGAVRWLVGGRDATS